MPTKKKKNAETIAKCFLPPLADFDPHAAPRRLIDKAELLQRVPVSFPTIWGWMRAGVFPVSRNIGGKSAWVETEIDAWIAARPANRFKPLKPVVDDIADADTADADT